MIFHHMEYDYWTKDGRHLTNGPEEIRYNEPHRTKYDSAMAEVLDYLGLDYADEDTGDCEWNVHVMRFGKRLLYSTDRGFVECEKFDSEQSAKDWFDHLEREYCKWLDECEMDV